MCVYSSFQVMLHTSTVLYVHDYMSVKFWTSNILNLFLGGHKSCIPLYCSHTIQYNFIYTCTGNYIVVQTGIVYNMCNKDVPCVMCSV